MIALLILGMAILVGLSFFFLLVAENMPATSEAVPLVGMYYTVTMIEVSCAFFMTCWVLRFHHQNPTEGEVPKWVRVSSWDKPCWKCFFTWDGIWWKITAKNWETKEIKTAWYLFVNIFYWLSSYNPQVCLLGYGAKLFRFKFGSCSSQSDASQGNDVSSAESITGQKCNYFLP